LKSFLETCKPRDEILAGAFNPEVFTASLGPIIKFYRGGECRIDNIYSNAEHFFREATYPTQGLRLTLSEVFGRIAGDMAVPAIHRLETAFGGGKTHALIACTHIACKGKELNETVGDILEHGLLPDPGTVSIAGVAGDEIPVHKPRGDDLEPYTLWGDIAWQIGGEELYRQVEDEANSFAAPGRTYFDKVFGGRKVLIMLDELAQYAARLEAARTDGSNQLAAFLMALNGYARNHAGIAVIVTLASAKNAFARQTERLAHLISEVRGAEVTEDDALGIGEKAVQDVTSVVARDAVQVTPVQAAEISEVLAKRLFTSIDREAAAETAEEYMRMYRRNSNLLPEEASGKNFRVRMTATYPFHPTLVNFLNNKLANAENFQGTRGVLRVLSLTVRSLWKGRRPAPMIHACHIDLKTERVVNEILARTGSSDLLLILNADIGSIDTGALEGGYSNAALADRRNPHPEGHPLYEYTWKTVFLHSLVGREEGIGSKVFGLTEAEALFSVSFPGLTPPQARAALEEINESAYYLRYEQGKYFASEEPTLNSILAGIRKTLNQNQVDQLLDATARKVVTPKPGGVFEIEHDVFLPEHLPDGRGKPVLGIIKPTAGAVNVKAMIETKGQNKAREQQNQIFILVPETVVVKEENEPDEALFRTQVTDVRQRIDNIARQVIAMRILVEKPQSYGVNPRRLEDPDFKTRKAEREQALVTVVSSIYTGLYYSSAGGHLARKEINTAGGEGGAPFIELIFEILKKDGEILTEQNTTLADLLNLTKIFFDSGDNISLQVLRGNFNCRRDWPVLEKPGVFDQIIRAGVTKDLWRVYRMGSGENIKPEEIYDRESDLPLGINLSDGGYSLITTQGAKQRGWSESGKVEPAKVRDSVLYTISRNNSSTVGQLAENLAEQHGEVFAAGMDDAVVALVKDKRLYAVRADQLQKEKPELIHGTLAVSYKPQPGDLLVTPAHASERGWISGGRRKFELTGYEGAKKFLPLLRRLGSIYNKGASSAIENLDIIDLELPDGGNLRLQLTNASPASIKLLGELFEVLDGIAAGGEQTEVYLTINNPDDNCLLIRELTGK